MTVAIALAACSKAPAPKPGRQELQAGGLTWRVFGGTWKTDGSSLVGSGGHLESVVDLTDGTIELDVEAAGPSTGMIGVEFRHLVVKDDVGHSSGYGLHVSGQAFNVFRGANDYWLPVSPEVKGLSTSSILDSKRNHVIVRMRGPSFQIEANGASLFNFVDEAYPHGHIDLWVESPQATVRFSNIHVTAGGAE